MADWALSKCERVEGFLVTASRGAANAKGAYSQLTAASTFPYTAITLQCTVTGGGGQTYLIDIAVGGAGSEQVVVPNLLLDSARAVYANTCNITIPVAIPGGSRIAVRVQEVSGAGTRTVAVTMIGRNGGNNYPPAGLGDVINYGADTATTNGVLVDPGATLNAYGAWAEIAASTLRAHAAIHAILGTNKQTSALVDAVYYFEIGIGGAGAEIALCEFQSSTTTGTNRMQVNDFLLSQQIPAGTRIAMRSKCVQSGVAAARHPTAVILGY